MKHAVRMIICLVASALIVFGLLDGGLELARNRLHGLDIRPWHVVLSAGLILAGTILFWFSGRLAEQLTDDYED